MTNAEKKYAVCIHEIAPVRERKGHPNEQGSMLLFGETTTILQEEDGWFQIECGHDEYPGWVHSGQILGISENEFIAMQNPAKLYSQETQIDFGGKKLTMAIGTPYYGYIGSTRVDIINGEVSPVRQAYIKDDTDYLLDVSGKFENTPYMWGSRSNRAGLDCSGLTQILFRFVGIKLPRNASQQALCGKDVSFDDAIPGDLAFFTGASGRIGHVALVVEKGIVLHATELGSVRYGILRSGGIIDETGKITSPLASIRRLVPYI